MYKQALQCGILPEQFWNYSPMEVWDLIESYWRKEEQELKFKIAHDFVMSEVHARYMLRQEGQDIPHPWEYYPKLFQEEQRVHVEKKAAADYEEYKERRKNYIAEFNRRRQQGG